MQYVAKLSPTRASAELDGFSLNFILHTRPPPAHPPRTSKILVSTNMEDNLNGRQPLWKMTFMEDNINGRQTQWKMISMKDDINGR